MKFDINELHIGQIVIFSFLGSDEEGTITEIDLKNSNVQVLSVSGTYHRVYMSKEESRFVYLRSLTNYAEPIIEPEPVPEVKKKKIKAKTKKAIKEKQVKKIETRHEMKEKSFFVFDEED